MSEGPWATMTKAVRQRHRELDEAIAAWRQGAGNGVRLWCGPGCGNCCTLTVNCTLAEAMAIAAILDEPQERQLAETVGRIISHARQSGDARRFLTGYRQAVGPCPFLDKAGHCAIYAQRPLACRALLATRPPDWCGVNLAELPDYERNAFLAGLDRSVVAFPTHYAASPREFAADFERGLIIVMMRTFGIGVTGNLPLLVWLAGQPGVVEALADGQESFAKFLTKLRSDVPFLVQRHMP